MKSLIDITKVEEIEHTMTASEFFARCDDVDKNYPFATDDDKYDASMNATVRIGKFNYDVYTEEAVEIYAAGLESIVEERHNR